MAVDLQLVSSLVMVPKRELLARPRVEAVLNDASFEIPLA